jgi:hypothetical protein
MTRQPAPQPAGWRMSWVASTLGKMTDPRATTPEPVPPTETVCGAVTVALVIYLIGLVLSMMGNTISGGSPLVTTIKNRLFSPWMVPAWLDLGFDYRLTYGLDDDADHLIEVRPFAAPGSAAAIRLPTGQTGEQARRWHRLARAVVSAVDDPDRESILPTAIGMGLMDEAHSDDVLVRIMRQPLPERTGLPAPPQQAFAARVRLVDGRPQLIRQEPRGEVAPVTKPPSEERVP